MNKKQTNCIPWLTLGLGLGAAILRSLLLSSADHRGLVPAGHPLTFALLGLTALAVILAAAAAAKASQSHTPAPGKAAAAGMLCLAAGIAVTVIGGGESSGYLSLIWKLLGLCAAIALLPGALHSLQGKSVPFLSLAPLCAFWILHMITRYRPWSGNPQWIEYLFELMAAACLLLFSYHRAAASLGEGSRRILLISGLAGLYCCIAALPQGYGMLLNLGGALWLFTQCCCLLSSGQETASGEDGSL